MSFFSDNLAKGDTTAFTYMADSVTYARGETSLSVPAIKGNTLMRITDQTGASAVFNSQDFIVRKTALGTLAPPQRGDIITDGTAQFRVLDPSPTERCWAWSDHARTIYRIHSKQVQ